MIRIFFLTVFCLFTWSAVSIADPVGTYDVVGQSPEDGSKYKGTVSIERYGQVYNVFWSIAGEEFSGTGVGAAHANGETTFSAASSKDTAISVAFQSDDQIGIAMFFKQKNGQWNGIWNYGESNLIGSETWSPK
jgi:hypothetical protein